MEVFLAFCSEDQIPILEATMEAWAEVEGCEPVGIRVPAGKYEMVRRITADNMAVGDWYILADLGCIPDGLTKSPSASEFSNVHNMGLASWGIVKTPTGVRFCRKGAVARWVPKVTDSYDEEHMQSVEKSGFTVGCMKEKYKRIAEC